MFLIYSVVSASEEASIALTIKSYFSTHPSPAHTRDFSIHFPLSRCKSAQTASQADQWLLLIGALQHNPPSQLSTLNTPKCIHNFYFQIINFCWLICAWMECIHRGVFSACTNNAFNLRKKVGVLECCK